MIRENIEALDIVAAVSPLLKPLDSSVARWWASLYPPKSKSFRKLSYFADKEGKVRVIGILDYWSQSCLRPLHKRVNRLLKSLKCDCTFDQNRFTSILPTLRLGSNSYHSLDLSAATDRMPITLQRRVVEHLYGSREKSEN